MSPNQVFTIYPAVDLRNGQVVRLQQGDPGRQTVYGKDPVGVARHWLDAGAAWLHVVNLDGAFGEADQANSQAVGDILNAAKRYNARIQLGGGLRSLAAIQKALEMGTDRVVLGTLAVERPELLAECLKAFGPDRFAVGIDVRDGWVQVRGWKESSPLTALELANRIYSVGIQWAIITDVARDGLGQGLNLAAGQEVALNTGLKVIASGGVNRAEEISAAWETGLAGVILGRALYEGQVFIRDWTLPLRG